MKVSEAPRGSCSLAGLVPHGARPRKPFRLTMDLAERAAVFSHTGGRALLPKDRQSANLSPAGHPKKTQRSSRDGHL